MDSDEEDIIRRLWEIVHGKPDPVAFEDFKRWFVQRAKWANGEDLDSGEARLERRKLLASRGTWIGDPPTVEEAWNAGVRDLPREIQEHARQVWKNRFANPIVVDGQKIEIGKMQVHQLTPAIFVAWALWNYWPSCRPGLAKGEDGS